MKSYQTCPDQKFRTLQNIITCIESETILLRSILFLTKKCWAVCAQVIYVSDQACERDGYRTVRHHFDA
jgi:hypothetical protein